jgi:hypothetical protein
MGGLPFKYRLFARIAGVNVDSLAKVWTWLDGKKSVIGLILTATGGLALYLPAVAVQFPNAKWIVVTAGIIQTVNGLLHKAYKAKYNEEHVDTLPLKK